MKNCPQCGRPLPPNAKFCFACGASVELAQKDDTLPIGLSASSLRAGALVFEDYVVESLIQADEAGERYVAHHRLTGQLVTVLLLAESLGRDEEMRRVILSEARRLARLHHPNIPVMFNLREEQGRFLAVFEHPEGVLVEQLLARQGALSPSRVLGLAEQLLAAIGEAHHMGLIHGALGPRWVYVDGRDRLMVTGFGFLQSLQSRRVGSRTGMDPRYTAPEQALGQPVDERTDLYLAGLLLFAMLAGRPPFDGPADYDILRGQVEQPPPDLRSLQPTVPPAVASAVGRALVKSPDGRFESAAAFLEALRRAARESIQERLVLPVSHEPETTSRGFPSSQPEQQAGYATGRRTLAAIPSARQAQWQAEGPVAPSPPPMAPLQGPPVAPEVAMSPARPVEVPRKAEPDLSVQPDESWDSSDGPAGPGSAALARAASGDAGRDQGGVVATDVDGVVADRGIAVAGEPLGDSGDSQRTVVSADEALVPALDQQSMERKAEQPEGDRDSSPVERASESFSSPGSSDPGVDVSAGTSSPSGFGSFFAADESYGGDDDFSDLEDLGHARGRGKKFIAAVLVLAALIGGGVGLYFYMDPYARVAPDKGDDKPVGEDHTGQVADDQSRGKIGTDRQEARPRSARSDGRPAAGRPGDESSARPASPRPAVVPPPRVSPDPPEAEIAPVRALWSKNKIRAIASLTKLLERYPASTKLKEMLGASYEQRAWRMLNDGLYRRTIEAAEKATRLRPDTTLAWFCLGYALRQTGKRQQAARAFSTYLARCQGKKCRMLGIARRYAKAK